MSKSKNPFPKEMLGVYYVFSGGQGARPVRAVERNGWYTIYRLPDSHACYEVAVYSALRWYDLQRLIDNGSCSFDFAQEEDISIHSIDRSEI